MRAVAVAATVVTAIVLGTGTTVGAGSSKESAQQWAGSVCSAFLTFGESVQKTLDGLKSSDSVESAANSAKQGIQDATNQLQSTLDDLGKPPTSNANKAQSTIQQLGSQLSDDADAIQQDLTPTPSSAVEVASAFAAIGSEIQKAVSQTQSAANTLKSLKGNNQLKQGFQNASSCQQLKSDL